jgi:hypothetical protein
MLTGNETSLAQCMDLLTAPRVSHALQEFLEPHLCPPVQGGWGKVLSPPIDFKPREKHFLEPKWIPLARRGFFSVDF